MNKDIINFIKEVINKKFSIKAKGYDPDEVDETLDSIFEKFKKYIIDYEKVIDENEKLIQLKNDYEKYIKKIESENKVLESKIKQLESSGISLQIMNERISNLEEINEEKKKNK